MAGHRGSVYRFHCLHILGSTLTGAQDWLILDVCFSSVQQNACGMVSANIDSILTGDNLIIFFETLIVRLGCKTALESVSPGA